MPGGAGVRTGLCPAAVPEGGTRCLHFPGSWHLPGAALQCPRGLAVSWTQPQPGAGVLGPHFSLRPTDPSLASHGPAETILLRRPQPCPQPTGGWVHGIRRHGGRKHVYPDTGDDQSVFGKLPTVARGPHFRNWGDCLRLAVGCSTPGFFE